MTAPAKSTATVTIVACGDQVGDNIELSLKFDTPLNKAHPAFAHKLAIEAAAAIARACGTAVGDINVKHVH